MRTYRRIARAMPAALLAWGLLGALPAAVAAAPGPVAVQDDAGHTVRLAAPARRIVSLSPHATELIFAAGGGERLVGTVTYSDHPEAARRVPRVGDNKALDLEAIAALRPDLIVVWRHGNVRRQLDKLQGLRATLYESDPSRLDDLPAALERLGRLMGTEAEAARAARQYEARLAALRARYAGRTPVRTFYQVWRQPLMTLNDDHMLSDAIRLCGGVNVFGHLTRSVPSLSDEAVLQADPELIFAAAPGATSSDQPLDDLSGWRRFPRLRAVAGGHLVRIDGDLLNRATPRMLDGAEQLCEAMEAVRRGPGG